jgi:periplasmic protein CpxP/Spy
MKKVLTAVAIMTLGASLAVAAPQHGKKHGMKNKGGHAQHMNRMAERLDLSEAQKMQMSQLRQTFRAENEPFRAASRQLRADFQAARQAGDTARAEALQSQMQAQRAEMMQRRQAQHAQMMTILTPTQREQLEAMKAERAAKQGQRGQRGQRGHHGHR